MKTVLVTGDRGFLGSSIVSFLKKVGSYKVKTISPDKDLRDYNVVASATRGVDWVFSMAANMGGVGYFSEEQYYPTIDNYLIDLNMLRACELNKVKRLFYPASACAYSVTLMDKGVALDERMLDWQTIPDRMYGWEKLSMLKLMRFSPVDCRVGVLHTIYGEGQKYAGKKAKFPPQIAFKAVSAIKTGKIDVWGSGEQIRTFEYINDAVEKIHEVMSSDKYHGEVNIGSDVCYRVREIVDLCLDILHIAPVVHYDKTKPSGPAIRLCDNSKFNEHYSYRSKYSIKDGFTRVINHILKQCG